MSTGYNIINNYYAKITLKTIDELKAYSVKKLTGKETAEVGGGEVFGDFKGGTFMWVPDSTLDPADFKDDDVVTPNVLQDPTRGRWQRVYHNPAAVLDAEEVKEYTEVAFAPLRTEVLSVVDGKLTVVGDRVTAAEGRLATVAGRLTTAEGKITTIENTLPTLAPKINPTFTSNAYSPAFRAQENGLGRASIARGGATRTGFAEFHLADGVRKGYIGNIGPENSFMFAAENSTASFDFVGAPVNINGFNAWHAGNFNPDNYALLNNNVTFVNASASTFTARTGRDGYAGLMAGPNTRTGYVGFWNSSNVRQGYIGNAVTNGNIEFHSENGGGFQFNNRIDANGGIFVAGRAEATEAVVTQRHEIDGNFYISFIGGQPGVAFDSADFISYNRQLNKYFFFIGNVAVMTVDAAGTIRARGNIVGNAGDNV